MIVEYTQHFFGKLSDHLVRNGKPSLPHPNDETSLLATNELEVVKIGATFTSLDSCECDELIGLLPSLNSLQ